MVHLYDTWHSITVFSSFFKHRMIQLVSIVIILFRIMCETLEKSWKTNPAIIKESNGIKVDLAFSISLSPWLTATVVYWLHLPEFSCYTNIYLRFAIFLNFYYVV